MLHKPNSDIDLKEAEIQTDPEFDQYWLEIAKQRIEIAKTGKSKTVLLQEVLAELECRL